MFYNNKDKYLKFCNSVGNNVSIAVNKTVLREQKLPSDGETVYEKLKEAELEMSNAQERYSKEEVLESMNNIIG